MRQIITQKSISHSFPDIEEYRYFFMEIISIVRATDRIPGCHPLLFNPSPLFKTPFSSTHHLSSTPLLSIRLLLFNLSPLFNPSSIDPTPSLQPLFYRSDPLLFKTPFSSKPPSLQPLFYRSDPLLFNPSSIDQTPFSSTHHLSSRPPLLYNTPHSLQDHLHPQQKNKI